MNDNELTTLADGIADRAAHPPESRQSQDVSSDEIPLQRRRASL